MEPEKVAVAIDPGDFPVVFLRREGATLAVRTTPEKPPSPPPPDEPWVPPPLPPPARAVRFALAEAHVGSVVWQSFAEMEAEGRLAVSPRTYDLEPSLREARPGTTLVIVLEGTNLIDFDDAEFTGPIDEALGRGADVLIRLER